MKGTTGVLSSCFDADDSSADVVQFIPLEGVVKFSPFRPNITERRHCTYRCGNASTSCSVEVNLKTNFVSILLLVAFSIAPGFNIIRRRRRRWYSKAKMHGVAIPNS